MKYFEFGKENEKLMVLLHGGGVCYRGAVPVAGMVYLMAVVFLWRYLQISV